MLRPLHSRSLLVSLLLSTAACTQPAAQIDLRGQNSYTRDGSASYASNSSSSHYSSYSPSAGSNQTQSTASVQSIGVSDLSAPKGAASSKPATSVWSARPASQAPSSPFSKASAPLAPAVKKIESKPVASNGLPSERINPWTRKPREEIASATPDQSFHLSPKAKSTIAAKEQMVSEVKPVAEKAKSSGLDSIVSNDADGSDKSASLVRKAKQVDIVSGGSAAVSSSGFMWPVNSKKVISQFGPKGKGKANDGINIASAQGEPVWAASDGEVVYVGNELQGYGNMVLIKHSGNKISTYAHLNRYTVDKYERIKQGDIIGYVGSTGNVKESQLHFAIRDGKDAVDPMKYLKRNVASLR